MEERFDRLEGKIDGIDERRSTRSDGVDDKIGGLAAELRAAETRLRGQLEDVDASLSRMIVTSGTALTERADSLNLKLDALHDDLKCNFRLRREQQQGLKEQMESGFKNQERSLKEALASLEAAIQHGNELRERKKTK